MAKILRQAADNISSDVSSLALESAIDTRRWPEVMVKLKELIGCQTALIVFYDFRQKSGSIRYADGISPRFQENYPGFASLDQWLSCEVTVCELGSPRIGKEPVSNRFYHDWLSPQKLYYGMHATLAKKGEVGIVCMLLRSKHAGPFENSEEATFCRVLPDLMRTWKIHERVTAILVTDYTYPTDHHNEMNCALCMALGNVVHHGDMYVCTKCLGMRRRKGAAVSSETSLKWAAAANLFDSI